MQINFLKKEKERNHVDSFWLGKQKENVCLGNQESFFNRETEAKGNLTQLAPVTHY